MKRFYSILCTFLLALGVSAQNGVRILSTPIVDVEYQVTSMSPNGKWACGNINDGNYRGFIWNLTTGEVTELSAMGDFSVALGVSDDGTVAGTFMDTQMAQNGAPIESAGYWKEGKWHHLNHTTADGKVGSSSMAYGVSQNGLVIAGIAYVEDGYKPTYWKDGLMHTLECDPKNPQGAIYHINNDATVACGWTYAPSPSGTYNRCCTYWKDGKRNLINPTVVGPLCVAGQVSPDGKLVLSDDRIVEVETGKETLFTVKGLMNWNFFDINSNGKVVGSYDLGGTIAIDGQLQNIADYLIKKGATGLSKYQVVQALGISEDEKTFALMTLDENMIPRSLVVQFDVNVTTSAPVALQTKVFEGIGSVELTWNEPLANAAAVKGYNVYRNGSKINKDLLTACQYIDNYLANGTYNYTVKAVYETTESEDSQSVTATVQPKTTTPVRNFIAMQSGINDVRLMWDAPMANLPELRYAPVGDNSVGFGGGGYAFESAIRFDKEILSAYKAKGYKITDVSFYPRTRQKSWKISFYNADDMSVLYTETIDGAKVTNGVENTIHLVSAVEIPEGKDIVMGVFVDVSDFGGYDVMGAVMNKNCKPGYTDLLRQNGQGNFFSIYEASITSPTGAYIYCMSWPMGFYLSNGESDGKAKSYKVFANGAEVTTVSGESYKQKAVADGTYLYEVAAVYPDGSISEKVACSLDVAKNTSVYKALDDVKVQTYGKTVRATWDAPANDDEQFITYAYGRHTGGVVGTENNQYSYMAATIYSNEKVRPMDGYQLKGFRFYPTADADFTFILRVDGQDVVQLPLERTTGYTLGKWNTVYLDEPMTISRNSEYQLILDCYDVTPEQAPLGMDSYAAYPSVSDLYSSNDGESFSSLSADGGTCANWMMGLVTTAPEVEALPIEGYNVMIDGKQQNTDLVKATEYITEMTTEGTHHLNVNVVYSAPIGTKNGSRVYFTIDLTGIEGVEAAGFSVEKNTNYVRVNATEPVLSITAYAANGAKVAAATGNELDITGLAAGVYVLRIQTEGKTVSAKISVAR